MRVVKGNKIVDVDEKEFKDLISCYEKSILDIGTGTGYYIYRHALKNTKNLYVGVDISEKNMKVTSVRAVKNKLKNVLYISSSFENLPDVLNGSFDVVNINFPWGSLLKHVVDFDDLFISKIASLFKDGKGQINIVFGFSTLLEPSETIRLSIEDMSINKIKEHHQKVLEKHGFSNVNIITLDSDAFNDIKSEWSNKLRYSSRDFYKITAVKV